MEYRYKVVITDGYKEVSDIERNILGKLGAEIVAGHCTSTMDIIDSARDADALLVDALPITRDVFDKLTKLKVVVRYGVGLDNIDVRAATECGVQVVNIPGAMTVEVAEHTVALLLAIVRKIPMADRLVKSGKWADPDPDSWAKPVPRIRGKTVGVLGFGRIGRAVADLLKSFKVRIVAYDPYVKPELVRKFGVRPVRSLGELLKKSDFITIHLPLTDQTRHMIAEKEFKLAKRGLFMVNCARGAIVDPEALRKALSEGQIAGFATDVFEKEPVEPNDPLLKLDSLTATPHMAFYSDEVNDKFRSQACMEIVRVLKAQRPANLVNPEVLVKSSRKVRARRGLKGDDSQSHMMQ